MAAVSEKSGFDLHTSSEDSRCWNGQTAEGGSYDRGGGSYIGNVPDEKVALKRKQEIAEKLKIQQDPSLIVVIEGSAKYSSPEVRDQLGVSFLLSR